MTRAEYVTLLTRIGVPTHPVIRTVEAAPVRVSAVAAPRYHSAGYSGVDLGSWDYLNSLDDGDYYDDYN